MHQLAVLTVLLDVADKLLFQLLGGVDRSGPPCKVPALLNRETSIIGTVLQNLHRLLERWNEGGECRRPWCVLDIVGASPQDMIFADWARAQIVRMGAVLSREGTS